MNNFETPKEEPKTPEDKFKAQMRGFGGTRSSELLEALKQMNSSKPHGVSFTLADAFAERKSLDKSGNIDQAKEMLHVWVIEGDRYGNDVKGISELQVERAIELLEPREEKK